MIAALPDWPDVDNVFIPGDEILIAFTRERMLRIGFPDDDFTGTAFNGSSNLHGPDHHQPDAE